MILDQHDMISEKSSSGRPTGAELIDVMSTAVRSKTTATVSWFPSASPILQLALSARRAAYSKRASDLGHERYMSLIRTTLHSQKIKMSKIHRRQDKKREKKKNGRVPCGEAPTLHDVDLRA